MTGDLSATFFGLPLVLKRADAEVLVADLERLFRRQVPIRDSELERELEQLTVFFDPLKTGSAIRSRLRELDRTWPPSSRLLRPPLVIGSGTNLLVTAEGRVALEVLKQRLARSRDSDPLIALDPEDVHEAQSLVYGRYRAWAIGRIASVLSLLEGKAERLRPLSVGWLLMLLVNGSRSEETALARPAKADLELKLDQALGDILTAFVAVFEPGAGARDFRLYQGWVATEARRRASNLLGPSTNRLYVLPGREDELLALVIRELKARRRPPSLSTILAAFDALVEGYRERLPVLASLGLAHERRAETRRIRDALEAGLAADPERP